jgi:hypothetical protein
MTASASVGEERFAQDLDAVETLLGSTMRSKSRSPSQKECRMKTTTFFGEY